MLSRGFLEALKIDDLNRKWGVRILFLVLLCLDFSFYFLDIGDTNFEALYSLSNDIFSGAVAASEFSLDQLPLTTGNWINLGFNFIVILANVVGSFIYCGMYVKDFRENSREFAFLNRPFVIRVRATTDEAKAMNMSEEEVIEKLVQKIPKFQAISVGNLVFRIVILSIIAVLLFFPSLILVYYLPLLLIMICPGLMLAISSYLSGDCVLAEAFATGFNRMKGFYFAYMSGITSLILLFIIAQFILVSVEVVNYSWVYALLSFITVVFSLAVGRYMGVEHCIINDSITKFFKKKQEM